MFKKKKTRLQIAQEKAQKAINKTNEKIDELGKYTSEIYTVLGDIQNVFDEIKNVPSEERLQYEELKKIRLNWKQQADKIEKDYKAAAVKNAGAGAAGAGVGVAVVALGPTAAMGVATTFGVASTGTAIATLHGAAATNAALAWLGGGALAAGGGGMAAGEAFLALAGPVGWAIAAVAIISSGLMFWKNHEDKKRIEELFTDISNRDIKTYELAVVELPNGNMINCPKAMLPEDVKEGDIISIVVDEKATTEKKKSLTNRMNSLFREIKGKKQIKLVFF